MFDARDQGAFKAMVELVTTTNEELAKKGHPPVVEFERSAAVVRIRFAEPQALPSGEVAKKR